MSITINDRLWTDTRFNALCKKIGRYESIGLLVEFWKVAKRHWSKGHEHVPPMDYKLIDPDELLVKFEFAKHTDKGVYCKGSESRFKRKVAKKTVSASAPAWEAYKESYMKRYGQEPVRNATVNGQLANLVKRLGAETPEVLKFYVEHSDSFYMKKVHAIGIALRDAESLRTQWKNRRAITSAEVKQKENQQHHRDQMRRMKEGEI